MSNLFEVMHHGPIVLADEDSGVLITINGAYLNWWNSDSKGLYDCADCRSGHDDLYILTVSKAMDIAKEWFDEVMNKSEE